MESNFGFGEWQNKLLWLQIMIKIQDREKTGILKKKKSASEWMVASKILRENTSCAAPRKVFAEQPFEWDSPDLGKTSLK